MLTVEQFAATLNMIGWSVIGVIAAILGMVVALIAFVGLRETMVGSQRRRDLVIDAAGFLIVLATALSTVLSLAAVLAAIPAPYLRSLSHPGLASGRTYDGMLLGPGSGEALQLQTGQVFIGFAALGLLAASKYVDRAVRTWFADEHDMQLSDLRLFDKRISERTNQITYIDRQWPTAGDSSSSRSVLFYAAALTALVALLSAGLNTLAVSLIRALGDEANNGWELFFGSALVAAAQALLVSIVCLSSWKVRMEGAELSWSTARRWKFRRFLAWCVAIIVTGALPALFLILRRFDPEPAPLWRVSVTLVLLFFVPAGVFWLRRGRYSWRHVAALQTKQALQASIRDDDARRRRLPAMNVATTSPAATAPATVAPVRRRVISFLGVRISW
ncbi:hypothetical protein SRABI76_01292 [Microbacterium oxydans]|nr:hypothetical protein SRABI76_01292 [Microbacterium oxydans]